MAVVSSSGEAAVKEADKQFEEEFGAAEAGRGEVRV
uniref:Uncharacterized protein n=1 Tax=Arundo donax TaxID=35708 RepID=A0A0A9B7Q2_ARUDO